MSWLCLSRSLLIILMLSICILQSSGNGGGGGGRGGGVWISPHSGLPDRRSSRGTVQLGVLGYYVWGSPNSQSSKRGYSNFQYPFLSSRKEKYSPNHLSQEDLERMPKHYRRIVESGGHLDDFKEYYLSDLYQEDMDQVVAERRELIDRFGSYERSTQS